MALLAKSRSPLLPMQPSQEILSRVAEYGSGVDESLGGGTPGVCVRVVVLDLAEDVGFGEQKI